MNKIIILVILLFLLSGCAPKPELSINEKIANQLIREIDTCDSKFESDSRSYDYCEMVILYTKQLIDEGFFSDEQTVNYYINEKIIQENISKNNDIGIESFKSDILGDI